MRKVESVMHGAMVLANSTKVVSADAYRCFDCGTHGIIESDVTPEDAFELITAGGGSEVYFRSDEALDDSTPETEAQTRIWWRARVGD
jgi:hypothetical protein